MVSHRQWLGDGGGRGGRASERHRLTLDLHARSGDVCSPLTLRAGIATGYALLFEGDDYIGSAVNMASRLCDIASHHQVLISAMGVERLPEGVTAAPIGGVQLAGSPATSRCFELTGVPAPGRQHRHRRALDAQPVHLIRRDLVTLRLKRRSGHSWFSISGCCD